MSQSPDDSNTEAYLRLLGQHERELGIYVHSLVLNTADAEDILQECKVLLWKRFESFEQGTHFLAWARKIALYQVLNFRRSKTRKPLTHMNEEFIEAVAAEIDKQSPHLVRRAEALQRCLKKLPEVQHKMILWRYFEDDGIEGIAKKTGRTKGAVYRALSRIRGILNECISKTLSQQTI